LQNTGGWIIIITNTDVLNMAAILEDTFAAMKILRKRMSTYESVEL